MVRLQVVILVMFLVSNAFADINGFVNQYWQWSEYQEEGKTIWKDRGYNVFGSFSFSHTFTPKLFLNADLRSIYNKRWGDNPSGPVSRDRNYEFSPTVTLSLIDPVYQIRLGDTYVHRSYSTMSFPERESDDNLIFFHFYLYPRDLPSFYFQFNDRKVDETYGNLTKERKEKSYLATSSYTLNYKDLRGSYFLTYIATDTETPEEAVFESKSKLLSGSTELSFSKVFLGGYFKPSFSYRTTFSSAKNEIYSIGGLSFLKSSIVGLYANGSGISPYVDVLSPLGALNDNDYVNATVANLRNPYQNIGFDLGLPKAIKKIVFYLKTNTSSPISLHSILSSLFLFSSNFMAVGLWQDITSSVSSIYYTLFDPINLIYKVEVYFHTPQMARYFRIVNMVGSISEDYWITEIEAYEGIPFDKKATIRFDSLQEEINFMVSHDVTSRLTIEEGGYVRRSEAGRFTITSELGKVFSSFSGDIEKSKIGEPFISVSRNYFAGVRYRFADNLSTSLRLQRSENVDSSPISYKTDNINFSAYYSPLERLSITCSIDHFKNYLDGEKFSEFSTGTFSVSSKLYRDLQLNMDFGARMGKSYRDDSKSSQYFLTGFITAPLTMSLYLNTNFSIEKSKSETKMAETESTAKTLNAYLSYRLGASMNLSYSLGLRDSDGNTSFSQSLYMNWRITPKILMNAGVSYYDSGGAMGESRNYYMNISWFPRSFLEIRLMYNMAEYKTAKDTKNEQLGVWVNYRF